MGPSTIVLGLQYLTPMPSMGFTRPLFPCIPSYSFSLQSPDVLGLHSFYSMPILGALYPNFHMAHLACSRQGDADAEEEEAAGLTASKRGRSRTPGAGGGKARTPGAGGGKSHTPGAGRSRARTPAPATQQEPLQGTPLGEAQAQEEPAAAGVTQQKPSRRTPARGRSVLPEKPALTPTPADAIAPAVAAEAGAQDPMDAVAPADVVVAPALVDTAAPDVASSQEPADAVTATQRKSARKSGLPAQGTPLTGAKGANRWVSNNPRRLNASCAQPPFSAVPLDRCVTHSLS